MIYAGSYKIKVQTKNEKSPYIKIDPEDFCIAFQLLPRNSLGIWVYLASAPNNSVLYMSPQPLCRTLGITRSSYYRALQDFIRYGYLWRVEDGSWIFNTKAREPFMVVPSGVSETEEPEESQEEINNNERTINININITGGIPTEGINISKEVSIPTGKVEPIKEEETSEEEKLTGYFWNFQM